MECSEESKVVVGLLRRIRFVFVCCDLQKPSWSDMHGNRNFDYRAEERIQETMRRKSETRSCTLKKWWSSPEGQQERSRRKLRMQHQPLLRFAQISNNQSSKAADSSAERKPGHPKGHDVSKCSCSVCGAIRGESSAWSEVSRSRNSESHKKLWRDPEYVSKQIVSRCVTQTKAEKHLQDLLDHNFPGFQFTGDGKFILVGKCPDFINEEQKLIIELFGDYWHSPDEVEPRVRLFEECGYKTLIIWEHELNLEPDLRQKIAEFMV